MAIRDRAAFKKACQKAMADFLARMPLEERLAGLSPKELVAWLTPEQIAKVVTSDRFLNSLTPEARAELRKKLER